LQKDLPAALEADPEALFSLLPQMKVEGKRMRRLEKDYAVLKAKEQEEKLELGVSQVLLEGDSKCPL
jgi:hypothetical protein